MPFRWIFERLVTYICSEYFISSYWYHCTVGLFAFFWHSTPAYYFTYFVCLNLPSWPFTVYILCFIYICIYPYIYPPHLCYRLNTVAEERMVRGCWLHRPLEIPLGTRRSSTSPWGGDDDHLLLHSLNHLRPLLRHASPAVCLVSRFIIPLYLHRTLGQVYFGYLR